MAIPIDNYDGPRPYALDREEINGVVIVLAAFPRPTSGLGYVAGEIVCDKFQVVMIGDEWKRFAREPVEVKSEQEARDLFDLWVSELKEGG